ncbi:hypothetical protein EJP67_11170 [Variovorax guangxiensis]|uniref:DUF3304 domain-containing protein n=1 Tax=Variovorax guangxiensis TaxID=1775474 RepID=A0A3S1A2R2_9BURK|nr:hypothetical protein [Variovorax guangxiensis]RUR67614.1 hypothetical protein EJP67_11170 [Variovorax guangxiensis]
MKTSRGGRCAALALGVVVIAVAGCTYSQINPEAAAADARANTGYNELKDIEPGTSKLVMRTSGTSANAQFAVSTAESPCQGFQHLGAAAYTGSGVVYPWIASALRAGTRASPYLVHEATSGQTIHVRGIGNWSTGGANVAYRAGSCGPVTVSFTPAESHAYTVEFVWGEKMSCRLAVMDATNPDVPQPVEVRNVAGCPAPSR